MFFLDNFLTLKTHTFFCGSGFLFVLFHNNFCWLGCSFLGGAHLRPASSQQIPHGAPMAPTPEGLRHDHPWVQPDFTARIVERNNTLTLQQPTKSSKNTSKCHVADAVVLDVVDYVAVAVAVAVVVVVIIVVVVAVAVVVVAAVVAVLAVAVVVLAIVVLHACQIYIYIYSLIIWILSKSFIVKTSVNISLVQVMMGDQKEIVIICFLTNQNP